ncbi:MAG: Flp pilus assembly protein CpaB [Rhodobacteraceae bacterium]|nr:Flp pilus assembly protein CpaB [Paracoccaceae bacterium]
MRMVFTLVLVLGVALAGFAVYMARGILNQNAAAMANQGKPAATVPLYVIRKDVVFGDVLKKEDVATVPWPKEAVPATAFTDLATLFPPGDNKTRVILRPMQKFEPILTTGVTAPGEAAGITTQLEAGMRAFAIKVDVTSGVSGFLRPGDRVDVYWTGTNTTDHTDVTRLIEPGISVVAVDQSSNADPTKQATIARTVTVQATPQQVATLAQAQATGKLALSLLGAQDTTVASAVEVDSNRLLGIQQQAPVAEAPKPKVCTVRQRSGDQVVEVPIPCTN